MSCVVCCVCLFLHPPSIFIGGSHGQGRRHLQLIFGKPTYSSNKLSPCVQLKLVGPTGRSADQPVGRPPSGPTDLLLWFMGSFLGPLVIGTGIGFCYVGFLLWWAVYSIFYHVSCPDSLEHCVLDHTTPLCCKTS